MKEDVPGPEKSVPSPFEMPVDAWIVRMLLRYVPSSVTPNQLTLTGAFAGIAAAISFYLAGYHPAWFIAAAVFITLHLVFDALDGGVARERGLKSKSGYFLDQYLDTIVFVFIPLGIGFGNYSSFPLWALMALMYPLHMLLVTYWILLCNKWPFPQFGPFEVHVAFIVLAISGFFYNQPVLTLGGFPLGIFDLTVCLVLPLSCLELLQSMIRLYRQLKVEA